MKRRLGLLTGLLTLVFALGAGEVTILGTADIHGDMVSFARLAATIRRYPDAIKVDAGDLIQGGYAAAMLRGEPLFDILNELGYSCFVPGNHEFEFAPADFVAWQRRFRGRILGAQWRYGGFRPASCMVVERSGYRIGLVGLTESGMGKRAAVCPGLAWREETIAVRAALTELRKAKCDAIVLVCHLPIRGDFGPLYRLLREFPEFDGAIAAHSHQEYPGTLVAERMAVQPGPRASSAARLVLHFSAGKRLTHVTGDLLRPGREPDPAVERIRREAGRRAFRNAPKWRRRFADISEFGRTAAEGLRRECGVDAAIFAVGTRNFFPEMDHYRLFRALPFGNRLCAVTLDAGELPRLARELETPTRRVFFAVGPGRRGPVSAVMSDYLWRSSPRLRSLPVRVLDRFERETVGGFLEKSASGTIL